MSRTFTFREADMTDDSESEDSGGEGYILKLRSHKYDVAVIVDVEDAERIQEHNWYPDVRPSDQIYAYTWINDKKVYLHDFIMQCIGVDHIDPEQRLDNRKSNLRPATSQQNVMNSRSRNNGYLKGVKPSGHDTWVATIGYNGESIYIGSYSNEIDAGIAYDNKAKELFGEFARVNFPNINQPTPNAAYESRSHASVSTYKKASHASSKYRGVNRLDVRGHKYWRATCKGKYIGYFTSEIDAAKAYDNAARYWFGEFACVNFPTTPGERCALRSDN